MTRLANDAPHSEGVAPLRVLVIEDDSIDFRLVGRRLAAALPDSPAPKWARSLAEGAQCLAEEEFDLLLLDMGLPDGRGIGNVETIMPAARNTPIIVLTHLDDEEVAAEAVRLGAQDYLIKGEYDLRTFVRSIRFSCERHAMQRRLAAALQRENEVKDQFLAHVSHELRTPLTAVMQFTTILEDGIAGELTAKQRGYLGTVRRNAEQLHGMIDTLMDVTRAEAGTLACQFERIDPATPVLAAVEAAAAEADAAGVRLEAVVAPELPDIIADRARLQQVVGNLLGNALKFTPSGGHIEVRVLVDADRPGEVCFQVRDTGCGMPEDACSQVFDRMYQCAQGSRTSRKGLGLGLYIAREILGAHGGDIWVESSVGSGSVFSFTVPAYSLARLVKQVAWVDGAAQPDVAVVAVEIRAASTAARARGVADVIPEVTRVLQGCILASSDVLVPLRRSGGDREWVVVLARASQDGAVAIERRVSAELGRSVVLVKQGFATAVRSLTFEVTGSCDGLAADIEDAIAEISSEPDGHESRLVLLVDDDTDLREAVAVRLRARDLRVCFAADRGSALAAARRMVPDVVLLDLGLPSGGGLQVLQELKSCPATAGVPVVVLSGRDPETHLAEVLEAGAEAFLQKPPDEGELLEVLAAVL